MGYQTDNEVKLLVVCFVVVDKTGATVKTSYWVLLHFAPHPTGRAASWRLLSAARSNYGTSGEQISWHSIREPDDSSPQSQP